MITTNIFLIVESNNRKLDSIRETHTSAMPHWC